MTDVPDTLENTVTIQGPSKRGRWKPGESGNPAGKPKGSKSAEIRKLLESHASAVIERVIQAALEGDMQACRIIIERLMAPKKANPIYIDIPRVVDVETAKEVVTIIIAAQSNGEIAADEAESLMKSVNTYIAVVGMSDFEKRLADLESRDGV